MFTLSFLDGTNSKEFCLLHRIISMTNRITLLHMTAPSPMHIAELVGLVESFVDEEGGIVIGCVIKRVKQRSP